MGKKGVEDGELYGSLACEEWAKEES
jgi:hypothetical protein